MSEKEKAKELVAKHFQIVAKAVGHKGIKTVTDTHTFAKIEKLSKSLAQLTVSEILELDYFSIEGRDFWSKVKTEIELL